MFKKKSVLVGLLAVVLLAGGIYAVNSNLNSIIKAALEKYGSQVTQTDVSISSVRVSLTSGEGTVSGFRVGNPKSFVSARAIDVGAVTLKLDTSTVTGSGPIVINEINVDAPQVTYEVGASGNSNLKAIEKNISSASGTSSGDKSTGKPARKVIIKNLYIRDGQVGVSHALLKGKEISAKLPTIHLKNIGGAKTGVDPQAVAKQVLAAVSKSAAQVGASTLAKELGNVGEVGKKVKDSAEDMKNSAKRLFSQ